ncbi:uncharacterized protein [Hetaerina americana]|uniref:uncharacterized protein n=1 Tax=Hetaerina americana TaxID=62018 RepID=UPI003A7F1B3E
MESLWRKDIIGLDLHDGEVGGPLGELKANKSWGQAPIGFLGIHMRIEATVLVNGSEERKVSLFAKRPPATDSHSAFVASCGLFRREATMYTSFAPRLKAALPPGVALPVADCYFARGEDSREDLIVMEDLRGGGYKMDDKKIPMDLARCRVVLDALARLHGASVLMERSAGPLYEKGEFQRIEEAVFVDDMSNPSCRWSRSSAETFASVASHVWPHRFGDEAAKAKLFEAAWMGWKEIFRAVRPSERYLNVLCHGDTWANNIMFREGSGGNVEVVLVDFQQYRYAPPVMDILFFLHSTTRREFRDRHLEDLLQYYREALSSVVSPELADQLLPLDDLRKSAEELRVFGRLLATSLLSVVLLSDEEGIEAPESDGKGDFIENMVRNRSEDVLRGIAKDDSTKERILESFQEFLESVGLWE